MDILEKFLFESHSVRGQWLTLEDSWQQMCSDHGYDEALRTVLGEAVASANMLVSTLKMHGSMSMQLQGDGPLRLLLVQASSSLHYRGLAQFQSLTKETSFSDMIGEGRLAITIEPGEGKQRYQGIVELVEPTLVKNIENYFLNSEQLPTRFWVRVTEENVVALLLQKLPSDGDGADEEAEFWFDLQARADDIFSQASVESNHQLQMRQLAYDSSVRVFDPVAVAYRCRCSKDNIKRLIISMGEESAQELCNEKGFLEIACEFCNKVYRFDQETIAFLFDQNSHSQTIH